MKGSMLNNLNSIVANTLTDDIKMIDISELKDSKDNFFAVERVEELAESILGQGGVKENLIVRPTGKNSYEVISGHRRKAAVEYLLKKGENVSRKLPCLVQNYTDENDKMIDIILMNTSQRVLSDSELMKSFEELERILKEKKAKGEKFGKTREKLAEVLNVSSSQVGKMQNVSRHALDEVKNAVLKGDMSLSAANEVARLDKSSQKKIIKSGKTNPTSKDISEILSDKNRAGKSTKKVDTNVNFMNSSHKKAYTSAVKETGKDNFSKALAYLKSLNDVSGAEIDDEYFETALRICTGELK